VIKNIEEMIHTAKDIEEKEDREEGQTNQLLTRMYLLLLLRL